MDQFNPHPFVNMYGGGSTPSAFLLLYSPRTYGDQVLRPFVYGFTDSTVQKLMGGGDSLKEAYARPDIATSDAVANAIKPDSIGSKISMGTYSSMWTFVLILNQPNNYAGVAMSSSGCRTTVMAGHCLDSPVAETTLYMTTPTINMNCPLVVQTHQIINTDPSVVNAFGMRNPTRIICSDDVIDPSMNMAAEGTDLYRMTPVDVLRNYQSNGTADRAISTPGLCMIGGMDRNPVQSALKTPGIHFRHILEGLDTQIKFDESSQFSPSGLGIAGVLSDCEDIDKFKKGVENNLSQYAYGSRIDTDGLSANSVFTIQDIERVFPNLTILPQQVSQNSVLPDGRYMDVLPQTLTSPKVAYSSFISSSVSSIAADCGLSSLSFAFTSCDPAKSMDNDKSTFQVVSENAYLTCPPPDPQMAAFTLKAAVNMFKTMFQQNVVPFIVGVVGNFEVFATYSLNAETTVNLTLLDYGSNTNLGGNYWFEAPNRLGSLGSTTIGNESVFMNNAQQLNEFVSITQQRAQNMNMGIPSAPVQTGPVPLAGTDYAGFGPGYF